MGICLDTEANSTAPDTEDGEWKGGGRSATMRTPVDSNMPLENTGKVKFDPPSVPVIFVLGGPGSGKVTHCDTLMEEKRGVTHINMMDLLHQHVISNDMQDFSQLSSRMVTEVLMLEMKMAPAAKAYLISGFPRSMRDVVEYSDKIQVVNGVILISWRQSVLQKQIDYGAKLGNVVLSLAKMELDNFFKNVIPVADYFDQSGILRSVNGERNPTEVYKEFRDAVFEILGAEDNQNALLNGVVGMGRGVNEIPGTIVTVETAPDPDDDVAATSSSAAAVADAAMATTSSQIKPPSAKPIILNPSDLLAQSRTADFANLPPIIWVIGGPGSNKSSLCLKAIAQNPGWAHFSVGRIVRTIADSDPKANTENHQIKIAIVSGEMVKKPSIEAIIENQLFNLSDKKGIIIDGYPRDIYQAKTFEEKYHQMPPIILLDCSKLQLGRGRLDDTVSSFRRRLEQFRELTLPMLKILDAEGRLSIVDGDTDNVSVQREFERAIRQHTTRLGHSNTYKVNPSPRPPSQQRPISQQATRIASSSNRRSANVMQQHETIALEDLDNVPGTVPTISNHISLIQNHRGNSMETDNNTLNNNYANHVKHNNLANTTTSTNKQHNNTTRPINNNHSEANGILPTGNPTATATAATNGPKSFRSMLEEAETYPIDL